MNRLEISKNVIEQMLPENVGPSGMVQRIMNLAELKCEGRVNDEELAGLAEGFKKLANKINNDFDMDYNTFIKLGKVNSIQKLAETNGEWPIEDLMKLYDAGFFKKALKKKDGKECFEDF